MLESSATLISGDFSALVLDPNGVAPISIIRTTDAFVVRCTIRIDSGAIMLLPTASWNIRLFLESVGPGPEVQVNVPARVIPVVWNQASYTFDIVVPAGTVEGLNPNDPAVLANSSGLYSLAAVLTLRFGTNMLPITGYHEISFLQFYTP
jgi:hypothetical protein